MTLEECLSQYRELTEQIIAVNIKRSELLEAYAKEHAEYKIGDRVQWDHGKQVRSGHVYDVRSDVRIGKIVFSVHVFAMNKNGTKGAAVAFHPWYMRGLRKVTA